jgi:hypothetical protein
MHQGATPFFERPVTTGDPEAFVHGVRPSSVSNLSAQPPRFAMRSLVCPSQPRLLSWGDVVRSMVLGGSVWGPHSLHTAEVTGSIPVTPTSQNASQGHSSGPFARRFARRSRAWGVFKAGQPGWARAAVESTNSCALVVPRWACSLPR